MVDRQKRICLRVAGRPNRAPRARWIGLAIALSMPACGPSRPQGIAPIISAFGPCETLTVGVAPIEDSSLYSAAVGHVSLHAAVGETVAFQLLLTAASEPALAIELFPESFLAAAEDVASPGGRGTSQPTGGISGLSTTGFSMQLFRLWPVRVEQFPTWYLRSIGTGEPKEFFDALVPINAPREGQPYSLAPGARLPIWVEIRIPREARAGAYQTGISILSQRQSPSRVPIDLRIVDVLVSPDKALPVFARVNLGPIVSAHSTADPSNVRAALGDIEARAAISEAFAKLHAHGLSAYADQIKPLYSQDIDGKLKIDWSDYDAFCTPHLDGTAYEDRRPAKGWPLPIDMEQPSPVQYDGLESPTYAAVLKDYTQAVREHFREKDWLDRSWVWTGVAIDPNPSQKDGDAFRRIAGIIRGYDSTTTGPASSVTSLVSTLIPQSMKPFGWPEHRNENVADLVDIWATPTRYHHRATMQLQRLLGKRVWMSPDRPPFGASLSLVAPRCSARALGWEAFVEDCDGLQLRAATDWPDKVLESALREGQTPDDAWLLYPGERFGLKEPIASVRLKLLQLGLQDYQLLKVLVEQGRTQTAKLLAGSLIKGIGADAYGDNFMDPLYGRRVSDGRVWQNARELLLEEAAAAVSERPDENLDRATNRARWSRFLSATRRIEASPEGGRAAVSYRMGTDALTKGPRRRRILSITHHLSIRNELPTAVEGTLRLGALPISGRVIKDYTRFGPLSESEVLRQEVAWEMDGPLPCDLDGHYVQQITVDAGATGESLAEAALSLVQAPPAQLPITVDGRLDDWVPNEFNAAGDFRRITFIPAARADSADGPAWPVAAARRPKAVSQTVVYFCRDISNLYIGFHAASPEDSTGNRTQQVTSQIAYEDLSPVGADLVELLLDPTNRGTLSDDLFHIVIKADGIGIFEKGIGMSPRIGRVEAWPGPAPRHAVVRTEYGWSAEIAVPLAAFGASSSKSSIWGLNIARAEPVGGEYSDWARSPRNCYDPRALGNLLWPE